MYANNGFRPGSAIQTSQNVLELLYSTNIQKETISKWIQSTNQNEWLFLFAYDEK